MSQDPQAFEFALRVGSLHIRMTADEFREFLLASREVWEPALRRIVREEIRDRFGRVTEDPDR